MLGYERMHFGRVGVLYVHVAHTPCHAARPCTVPCMPCTQVRREVARGAGWPDPGRVNLVAGGQMIRRSQPGSQRLSDALPPHARGDAEVTLTAQESPSFC